MANVDLVFHYGGDWTSEPTVAYARKNVHKWPGYESDLLSFIDLVNEYINELGYMGVQQLIVSGPSGKYYEIEDDAGIRALLDLVSDKFRVINLYAVEDLCELGINVPNIVNHNELEAELIEPGSDASEWGSDEEESSGSEYSDSETEELESYEAQRRDVLNDKLTAYRTLDKTMTFKDIPEARKVMNLYALANGYALELLKSDKTRLRFKCDVGCPFVCLISKDGNSPGVRVKTLNTEHSCHPAYDNHRVDAKTIAYYFKKRIQGDPKFRVKDMKAALHDEFNINVSGSKCKRAKKLILEVLEGSFVDDYRKIVAYANELRETNPGSDVIINISKDALAEGKRRFLRMYICFQALKAGYKEGLRPFIGLDGTFLRGKARGMMLVAVAQDSMNHFYPLTWAIVDKETKVTWTWFLGMLKNSLDLNEDDGVTFISDMQKGLYEAMKDVLPEARHRFCVKHIEANWCKRWRSGEMKKLLWWCAWSSYKEEFVDNLNQVGELDQNAATDMVGYPVKAWVRAFFDTTCKNQSVDNNLTESFNSWILDARYKPIIGMLEDIRIKVVTMLRVNELELRTWDNEFSPQTIKLYLQFLRIASSCSVVYNGASGYEVTEQNNKHTVNLELKNCTCRTWDLTGIPCPHAIKALQYMKIDPLVEIHWWLSKEAYALAYKNKLQPVRGEKFWRIDPSDAVDPPAFVSRVGRPPVKRTRQPDEAINRQGA